MRKLAVLTLFVLIALAPIVVAQNVGLLTPGPDVLKLIFGPSIPNEWYNGYNVFQFLIFPFLLIMLVMYGIMSEIHIFRRNGINAVIAVLIAFMASYSGALVLVVRWTTTAAGIFGYSIFIVVLFVGIGAWGYLRLKKFGLGRGGFNTEALRVEEKLNEWRDYMRQCQESNNPTGVNDAMKHIATLERQLFNLKKHAPAGKPSP